MPSLSNGNDAVSRIIDIGDNLKEAVSNVAKVEELTESLEKQKEATRVAAEESAKYRDQVEELTRQIDTLQISLELAEDRSADLRREIESLNKTINNLKDRTGFDELTEKVTRFERTAGRAVEQFKAKMTSLRVLGDDEKIWDEFGVLVSEIESGTKTVDEAITDFKLKHPSLLEELLNGGSGGLDADLFAEFRASLQDISTLVQSVSRQLADMQENGVKAVGAIAGGGAGYGSGGGNTVAALDHIASAFGELSDDAKESYKIINQILEGINAFSNVDPSKIFALSQTFQSMSGIGKGTFGDSKVDNIIKMAEGLQRLSETSGRIPSINFEVKASKAALNNLATYLPVISNDVNYDNLAKLQNINFDNFKDLRISRGSLDSISEFIKAINDLKEQLAVPIVSKSGGISSGVSDITKQAEGVKAAIGNISNLSASLRGANIEGVFDRLTDGGVGDSTARVIADAFSGMSGVITDVETKYREVIEDGEKKMQELGAVTVRAMTESDGAISKTIYLTERLNEETGEAVQIATVYGKASIKFDPSEQFNAAKDAVKDYYALLQQVRSSKDYDPSTERWAGTAKQLEEAKRRMDELTSSESKEKMLAEDRLRLEQLISVAKRNAGISENKKADIQDAKESTEQFNAAKDAVKGYYELLQKLYGTGNDGLFKRENISEQNGVFVTKSDNLQEYVSQLNSARMAAETYRENIDDLNITEEQREKLVQMLIDLQDKLNISMESAERSDSARAEKERNDALEEGRALLEKMVQLREQYNGKLRVVGSDAFQGNEANINELQAMLDGLENGSVSVDDLRERLEQLRQETNANADTMGKLGGATNSLASGMTRYFAMMFSGYRIIMKTVQEIKKMVSTSIELDSAMTQMQIVTKASDATMRQFGETAAQVAKETATSITDVVDSATVFARLGYSLDESAVLSKYTGMLQRVGNIEVSDAQDAITAIIKAYKIDANDIEFVMDRLVEVGNNFPISVSQIAEGMNNAAASLSAAGNSFEESVALLTAANTIVQNASKASTGLRTISARLRNTKAELDELGEEPIATPKYEELVQQLTDYNVSLLDAAGNYRSTYDILHDLAMEWDNIAPNIQAAITTALAGTRQQAIFNSIISQFKEASGAMDAMADSAGALSAAYDTYMDSTQAHIDQFKAAFQELSQSAIDSNFIKDIVDLGTSTINILNTIAKLTGNIGGLNTVLAVTIGIIATIKADAIVGKIQGAIDVIHFLGLEFVDTFTKARASGSSSLSAIAAGLDGVTASASAAQLAIGTIAIAVAGLVIAIGAMKRAEENARMQAEASYDAAMANVKESESVYNLYVAYLDAQKAMDDSADSKRALEEATNSLADALGNEGEAAKKTKEALDDLTLTELDRAVHEAKASLIEAEKLLTNKSYFTKNLRHYDFIGYALARDEINGDDLYKDLVGGSVSQRANAIAKGYDLLVDWRNELIDLGDTESGLYKNIGNAINYFSDDITKWKDATDALSESQDRYTKALNETAAVEDSVSDRESDNLIRKARTLAEQYNSLTNGNVDYRRRPLLLSDDLADKIPEMADNLGQLVTTYFSTETIGSGEARYTVDITPITEDGKVLTESELQDYLNNLVTDSGLDGLLASDESNLIINATPGEFDEESWNKWYANIERIKDAHAELIEQIHNVYGVSYDDIRLEILRTVDTVSYYNQAANDIKSKLSGSIGTDDFSKTEEELRKLAKTVNGITPDKIIELAQDSDELSSALLKDGMDAKFLAHVLQVEFTTGNGLDLVTDDALRLNSALEGMSSQYDEVTAAKYRYDAALSVPEKDDDFKSMAEAFSALNDEFVAGTTNSNKFWAAAEFLFGEDLLDTWGWDLEKIHNAMQENVDLFKDADSAGKGFIDRLKEMADENGEIFSEDGGLIATIEELEDGGFHFDIDELGLDDLAEKMNISKEAIEACIKALGKWGKVDFYNVAEVMDAIQQNGIGTGFTKQLSNGYSASGMVVDKRVLEEQMKQVGQSLHDIRELESSLRSSGVILLDVAGDAGTLAQNLVAVGAAVESTNGITIDINGLAQLLDAISMSEEDARKLVENLMGLDGVTFTDGAQSFQDADKALESLSKKRVNKPESDVKKLSGVMDTAKQNAKSLSGYLDGMNGKTYYMKLSFLSDIDELHNKINNLTDGNAPLGSFGNTGGAPISTVRAHAARGMKNAPPGYALTGEEEPEMVVQDGQARLVGLNGPEVVRLNAGAIVYNGQETRRIMKSLRHINGSIPALRSGYSPGTSVYTPNTSWSNVITGASSGSGSGSVGSGSGSSGSSSLDQAETWFEKEYKLHQHMLKMEAEDTADYLNWLNIAYQKAYNTNIITLDQFRQYQEEVYDGMKNLFMDYLNDIEHEISMRNGFVGSKGERQKIIALYKQMIGAIEDEIQAARARGLTDTDDYIQELQQKWASYFSELSDMREEIVGNVKDSIENLIDIRSDMIKQDVDDEKDALNERLSNLKDFYDKQKDLLRDSRDEEKYLDDQAEKRKKIADLEFKLAELELDNSASAQKRRAKLLEDLEKAQKDLDDFEKDHALDVAEKELDKIYERQEKEIEDRIKSLESQIETPYELRQQAIEDLYGYGRTGDLYQEMIDWNRAYGDGIDATITEAWETAYKALEEYKEAMEDPQLLSLISTLGYPAMLLANATGYTVSTQGWDYASTYKNGRGSNSLSGISKYASGTKSARSGLASYDEAGTETFISKDGTKYRMFTGGEMVLNHKASRFLYNFATSGGEMLANLFKEVVGGANALLGQKQMAPQAVSMGDIIIQGNADMQTVSEIRRAQRDALDNMLREFKKLSR